MLGALAHDTRLAVFRLLVRHGRGGLPAGRIAEQLDVPPPTLSFHLSQLVAAGLVGSRRESRSIVYAVDFGAIHGLLGFLTENCCRSEAECTPVPSPRRKERKG